MSPAVQVMPVAGLPEIAGGDRLGELIVAALREAGGEPRAGDIVSISQKAVSKAERRVVDLTQVDPTERARTLASRLAKDARIVELALRESRRVVRAENGVLIVETRSGLVCANAGIDASNVPGIDHVTLLPEDPDASARRIRDEIRAVEGVAPAIVIADSFGRPWRLGQADVAIGCAGLVVIDDWDGRDDREGRPLAATAVAIADEVAAAADLARAKDEGIPACVVRGLERFVSAGDGPGAAALRRPDEDDLFR